MAKQKLLIDVQFNGIKRSVQMLETAPLPERYEEIIELPMTIANGVLYEPTVYIDGIEMDENEAKALVVEILESPILRAKLLGSIQLMKHDEYWNIIFLIDTMHDPNYAILNAKYEDASLEIPIGENGEAAFLALDKTKYPLEAIRNIYELLHMPFSEIKAANLSQVRAYIGMKDTIALDEHLAVKSIANYLRSLRG